MLRLLRSWYKLLSKALKIHGPALLCFFFKRVAVKKKGIDAHLLGGSSCMV